jgi:hypothetical protein
MRNFTSFPARLLANLFLPLLYLTLIGSWIPYNVQAQTSAQIEQGTDCNWPFSDVATNPVNGKIYGFWRKGSGATAVYKLIRWDGSWNTVGTFTTSAGSGSTNKVPEFNYAYDDVSLAIDAVGHFHVTFQGQKGSNECCGQIRGVWYGFSTDGSSWTFTEIQTVSDPNGWKNTDDPVIEVDANNRPHIAFNYDDVNGDRTHAIRYYRYDGTSWTGQTAFSQTGASNEVGTFDLAIDGAGKAHIAFQRETDGSGLDGGLWYVTNSSGSWGTATELAHGAQGQVQGSTISIDTDANNKVHIVYSGLGKLNYITNISGSFSGGPINGNLTGSTWPHGFRINSKGDKFIAMGGLNYAYQLNGGSGPNGWTTGQVATTPDGNFPSGLLNPSDNRVMFLFSRRTNTSGSDCGTDNPRNLWYATTTIQGSTTPAPTFTGSPTATAVCVGQNATFTATATGATSFQWQEDDNSGFTSPTTLSTGGIYTISTSGTTSTLTITTNTSVNGRYYRAVASNSGGSTNSSGVQLTVNAKPTVSVTPPAAVCAPTTVNLNNAITATGGSAAFFTNTAATAPLANANAVATSGTYYVKATSGSGCVSDIQTISVTVNAKPVVTVAQPAAVCAPTSVNLNSAVTSSVGGSTFGFFTNTAATTPLATPTAVTTSGTYYVKATSGAGCVSDIQSINVTINAKPTVSVTPPAAVCAPASVNLNNAVTATGGTAAFFTNAGATTPLINPSSVTASGTYYVKATSGAGCASDVSSINVTVNPKPVVSVAQPAAVCFPATVNLTGTVSVDVNGSTFAYFTDPAATNPLATPTAVTTSGTYYVKATSTASCVSEVKAINVTVNPKPVVSVVQPAAVCAPTTVDLSSAVSADVNGSTFAYFTDPAATNPLATPTAVTTSGTYYVKATTGAGCSSEVKAINVIVNPKPVVSVAQPAAVCAPTSVNLNSAVTSSVGGSTFSFFTDPAATISLANASAVSATGTYYVKATSGVGCVSDVQAINITVNAKPVVTVTQPAAVCFPATVNLTNAVSVNVNGSTFAYFTDLAATNALATPTAVATSGTYYVKATSGASCSSDISSINVTVNAKPVVTVAQPAAVCFPATVNLTGTVSVDVNGSTFAYFTDPAATTPLATPTAVTTSGTYYVKATSTASCVSEVKAINVTVNPKPVVSVVQPAAVCAPTTVDLTSAVTSTIGGSTFSFFTDAAANAPVANANAVSVSGTYYVRATSGVGCVSDIQTINVTVNPKPVVSVAQPAAVCFPATVNLTGTVSVDVNGSTFAYFTDPAATNALATPTAVTTSGTYYVKATSTASCVSETKAINVTINSLPTPTLANNGPLSDSQPTVALTATGGNTYAFGSGASQQGGASGATASVTQPGAYQVTAISAQGCTAAASTTVTGGSNPGPACRNGSMIISVVATGNPVKYEWYRNSINSARLTENPAQVRGTSTSSLTLVNQQVTANYYVRVTDANGTAVVYGPIKATVDMNCNIYGRVGTEEGQLKITLLGNPIAGEQLRATVSGAAGKALNVQLIDLSGKPVSQQQWQQAELNQSVEWQLSGQPSGVYLLQANTEADSTSPAQRHSLKVIKQ